MTIDDYLSAIYSADIRGKKEMAVATLKTALANDALLMASAATKLKLLDELVAARGELACAYSAKYRGYLKEALA